MILQAALNASTLSWQAIAYDAIDGVRNFLHSASPEDHIAIAKVGLMLKENMRLAQRPTPV